MTAQTKGFVIGAVVGFAAAHVVRSGALKPPRSNGTSA